MSETCYWLALSLVPKIGPKTAAVLVKAFGSPAKVWQAAPEQLNTIDGVTKAVQASFLEFREKTDPQEELIKALSTGAQVITLADEEYPENLKEIYDPPIVLYVKGKLNRNDKNALAVVGTRRVTNYGKAVTRWLTFELARRGITIISGLARGVDTYAHKAALEARGRTIAVLGSGIDVVYPPENEKLLAEITASGAVISEFPIGAKADAWHFPVRNRVISGLSKGILVTEGGAASGALITADYALEQGREIFAVPGPIKYGTSEGPHKLIKEGAKLIENYQDILDELTIDYSNILDNKEFKEENLKEKIEKNIEKRLDTARELSLAFSEEEREVYSKIIDPKSIEQIIQESQLTAPEIHTALILLETKGVITRSLDGRYTRAQ